MGTGAGVFQRRTMYVRQSICLSVCLKLKISVTAENIRHYCSGFINTSTAIVLSYFVWGRRCFDSRGVITSFITIIYFKRGEEVHYLIRGILPNLFVIKEYPKVFSVNKRQVFSQ